jgi:hypothetical protein
MIRKLILTDSYDFNDLNVALVPLHRRGVDAGWLEKRAADGLFSKTLQKIADEGGVKGHSVLHVLAVGDEEAYGPNRNCDGFSEKDNVTAHTGFKENGHVFKNHKNHSPILKTGEVLATAHNPDMRRIELLIALDNTKYAEELDAFARGEDIPVSMGSKQDYDVCSYCGHKAPTARHHCDHIKTKLGEVLADGRQIYMQNPNPKYFDISTVYKPADRIGYALAKVASQNGVIGGHELAEAYGLDDDQVKKATLVRLAEIEKRVAGHGKAVSGAGPMKLSDRAVKQIKQAADLHGVEAVLTTLHRAGHMLSFQDFTEIIVGQSKLACMCGEPDVQGGFSGLLEEQDPEMSSLDGHNDVSNLDFGEDTASELNEKASMKAQPVGARIVRITIMKPADSVKSAGIAIDRAEHLGLSRLYLHYKLAFAAYPSNRADEAVLTAVAASNDLRV